MANFRYSAMRSDGARITGAMEGTDRSIVLRRLGEQGLHPIDVESSEGTVAAARVLSFGGGVASAAEISIFTRELAWLLRAGMSLNNALEILAKEAFSRAFGAIVANLRTDIRKGRSFHEALAERKVFSPYYISMIEVGEASGTLPAVLERLTVTRDRERKVRGKLVSALTYPSLL